MPMSSSMTGSLTLSFATQTGGTQTKASRRDEVRLLTRNRYVDGEAVGGQCTAVLPTRPLADGLELLQAHLVLGVHPEQ